MKTKILFMLMAILLMGCHKEKHGTTEIDGQPAVKIRIYMGDEGTKGVEGEHSGSAGSTIKPQISAVTVYAYNDYGKLISQLDLSKEQRDAVLYESGELQTSVPGAIIGLPVGTKKMDVVLNNPSDKYTGISENINYYNYRNGEEPADFPKGSTIFNRTFLTTEKYGVGYDISSLTIKDNVYEANFEVKPMMSRFEIYNSINVKKREVYKDNHKQSWKKIESAAFLTFLQGKDPLITKIDDALKPNGALNNKYGVVGPSEEKESSTVTNYYYYIPANYWFVGGDLIEIPTEFIESSVANDETTDPATSKWTKSPYYADLTSTPIEWYPNIYHAVDLEEVFINNIKVRSAALDPYLHPWPGADKADGWPHWYKAYHPYGWHTNGSSADNTFLCMGNVWDRIADSADKLTIDWAKAGLSVPGLIGSDQLEMQVLRGKATPIAAKSAYGDEIGSRNLGIIAGQAASYHIYPQEVNSTNKDILANSLPHLILKVKCYSSPENYAAGTAVAQKDFITIKIFSGTAYGNDYIKKFDRGYIYRVNLEALVGLFKAPVPVPGTTPNDPNYIPENPVDPDPEMPGSQVNVKIQVVPWTIKNIFPGVH